MDTRELTANDVTAMARALKPELHRYIKASYEKCSPDVQANADANLEILLDYDATDQEHANATEALFDVLLGGLK